MTSISPGMVESPMTEHMDFGDRKKLETRDIAEAVVYIDATKSCKCQ